MGSTKSRKKKRRKEPKEKKAKGLEEERNIHYHDVNPQWNYTISPRKSHDKRSRGIRATLLGVVFDLLCLQYFLLLCGALE